MKKILVCGAGGFIGNHLVNYLKQQGHYVIGADLKYPQYSESIADKFYQCDLRYPGEVASVITKDISEIYQLAADMGGAGYINTGAHDADVMSNNVIINSLILKEAVRKNIPSIFYASSACVYPEHNQIDTSTLTCAELSVYPANPDTEYGWEKLFSERMYLAYAKNYNLRVRIARLHNVFGPFGDWNNGREKAPAALCRKVAEAYDTVEVWGDGQQGRSFLYIDECLVGIEKIMRSECTEPLNLGSEQLVTIDQFVNTIARIANKSIRIAHVPGPQGVRCRTSDNILIQEKLNWKPNESLESGIEKTYHWIKQQIDKKLH